MNTDRSNRPACVLGASPTSSCSTSIAASTSGYDDNGAGAAITAGNGADAATRDPSRFEN